MSQAIKIGNKQKAKVNISQSIPASFYKGYIPPTPKINPVAQPKNIPNFALPAPSPDGVNFIGGGSYSMKNNQHPLSMPAKSGGFLMNQNRGNFAPYKNKNNSKKPVIEDQGDGKEADNNAEQLANDVANLKVGSFTLFEVMGGSNVPLPSIPDEAQSNSTFDDEQDQFSLEDNQENQNDNTNNQNSNNNQNSLNNNTKQNNNNGNDATNANGDNDEDEDVEDDDDAQFDMDD